MNRSRDYQARGAEAAAAAGLTQQAAPPPTPAAPARPDNVAAIDDKVYVCDGTVAGANNISCREVSADGKQCTAVTLADGVVGWRDSVSTKCSRNDLAERKAFLAQDPTAAAAVAAAQPGFSMDADGTRREIDRLNADPLAAALDSLPKQCRADFEKFLASGSAKSQANAAQAAASYAQIDKRPECRDAVKRIADALGVALPHRKIAADQRNDWNAALAGPQRASIEEVPDIDISGIPATGFDANDSLDSAIDMMNALSGALGAAQSMRSVPSYRPAPVYRQVAPAPRTYSGSSGGSQSTITGTTGN